MTFMQKIMDKLKLKDPINKEEIEETLNHVRCLANIINTTTDRETFINSLSEIKNELSYLSSFEQSGIFYNSTPSKDLKRLLENEHLTWEQFGRRCAESNNIPPEENDISHYQDNYRNFKQKEKTIPIKQKEKEIPVNENNLMRYETERYAVMCNAYLEHQDEMEQYKKD